MYAVFGAELVGKGQSTIAYWATAGTVPTKWHPRLLELAAEKGLDLQPSDFLPPAKDADLIPAGIESIDAVPKATHWGELDVGGTLIPCCVLNTGDRVFSRKGVVVGLIGTQGGQLAEYLKVRSLQPHLPVDLIPTESADVPALFRVDTGGAAFLTGLAACFWAPPVACCTTENAIYEKSFLGIR